MQSFLDGLNVVAMVAVVGITLFAIGVMALMIIVIKNEQRNERESRERREKPNVHVHIDNMNVMPVPYPMQANVPMLQASRSIAPAMLVSGAVDGVEDVVDGEIVSLLNLRPNPREIGMSGATKPKRNRSRSR